MNYKFEQFNESINCESWKLAEILDKCNGFAIVSIKLTDVDGKTYGHTFEEPHEYTKDLAKTEVESWIVEQLKTFEA